jgi:N-acetyl-anhydromuramyl-L-alanine amidase AmpD
VLHSTESDPGSAKAVAGYLAQTSTQADIHVIVDDDGDLVRLVPDGRKAWHVANFNSVALGIEQVGRAAQELWPRDQLDVVARQIACWSRKYGIPIQHSSGTGTGVVYHSDLGVAGGGHHDPGTHYPLAQVLALARKYR